MNKKSELDCYLYYCWNAWSFSECNALFDQWLAKHIWSKWESFVDNVGYTAAPASFYASLDTTVRAKIVARAVAHYNK